MANEQTRATLKTALNEFDDSHLQKIMVAAYDRWNWDNNAESDKDWYQLAEELLNERGVDMTANTINMAGPNGNPMATITLEATGDLVLGVNGNVKVTDSSAPGNIMHELFEVRNNSQLQLGWELKQAIVSFLAQEMINGSISGNTGQTLSQALEGEVNKYAPTAVRNLL